MEYMDCFHPHDFSKAAVFALFLPILLDPISAEVFADLALQAKPFPAPVTLVQEIQKQQSANNFPDHLPIAAPIACIGVTGKGSSSAVSKSIMAL
jgi:hypothetical protein